MAFNLTPESLGLMMGGLNMMAASRGGNTDLSKGGLGYALNQGLQGGLQGLQLGKKMQQGSQKQQMINDMLTKLNLDPTAQQSTGVLAPGIQGSALSNLTPEQKEMAKMAIMSGDWKSIAQMMSPEQAMTPYQRETLKLQEQRLAKETGDKAFQPVVTTDAKGNTRLVMPTYKGGQASAQLIEMPEGFSAAVETPEQKRTREAQSKMIEEQNKVLGKAAGETAGAAFKQIEAIKQNNVKLNEVIRLVDVEGANTGPLINKLPSIQAASVRLSNLQGQLGLDVVSSVTFGALSEKELQMAMNVALPTGLQGPQLVQWAKDKIAAQEKLSGYLETQAKFLSKPGNTQADWLDYVSDYATDRSSATAGNATNTKQSSEDAMALEWARKNPNDPRAKQIMMMQGAQ